MGARKKTAARIATAPSAFRLAWLDDERLVYQAGAGKQSQIHVLEVATKKDSVLKPRAGAALVGFSGIVCPGASLGRRGRFGRRRNRTGD